MSKTIKIFLMIFLSTALIVSGRYFLLKSNKPPETYVAEIKDKIEQVEEKIEANKTDGSDKKPFENQLAAIPEKISMKVPFASQAPFGVWDQKHEEACEEASLIMIHAYLNKNSLTPAEAENEIQKMIQFEIDKYGDYTDTNAEQSVKLYYDFYGAPSNGENLRVVYDFSKNAIKEELTKGNPVIIPAAGRELGNPYYTQPGPLYHMLVLTGYSGDQIITNDPGTRRGEGYRYDIDVLYGAIHDFPGDKNKVGEGRKAMITIKSEKWEAGNQR